MKTWLKITLGVIGFLVIVGFIYSSIGQKNTGAIIKEETPKVKLTPELIKEVCREIKVYTDYCYETGISAKDCGEQIVDKLMRIFDLTPSQILEITSNCK